MPNPRLELLRLAAQLAGSAATTLPPRLTVTIKAAGVRVTIKATDAELAECVGGPALSPMDEAIIEALADGPMQAAELAERAGYASGGQFRTALAKLVRLGLITHERGIGYSRPDPPDGMP